MIILFLDIDECETDTDNCDINADCTNTIGSYTCKCRLGYSGNGVSCNGKKLLLAASYIKFIRIFNIASAVCPVLLKKNFLIAFSSCILNKATS